MEDPRWSAAVSVLDDVVGPGGPDDLVRDGSALLVRRGAVMARVRVADEAGRAVSNHELHMAETMAAAGVAAIAPLEHGTVHEHSGSVVTLWHWYERTGRVTPLDVGRLARTLRQSTAADGQGGIPWCDPLAAISRVVADIPGDDPARTFVTQRATALAGRWLAACRSDPNGLSLVHGDLHSDNVIPTLRGPILADLELAGWGPASFDAAPTIVARGRFGLPEADLDEFLEGFGPDPREWEAFEALVDVYELWATAWAVGTRDRSSEWHAEAERRVATLRDGTNQMWTLR